MALSRRAAPRFLAVLARLQRLLRGLICAAVGAGLTRIDAREYAKRLITGCVIVAAVILDRYRRRFRKTHKAS